MHVSKEADMRGPKPKYPIRLTDDDRATLQRLVAGRTSPQAEVSRARIVLSTDAHPEWSNQQIARHCSCSDRHVREWRKRWVESHSLKERPRSGRPRVFPL